MDSTLTKCWRNWAMAPRTSVVFIAKGSSRDMEVLVERRGRVGLVTLNRPEKLNALNTALVTQFEQALQDLDADDAIGAIVVTGAGERAFSAGGDMAEQVASLDSETRAQPRVG